MTKATLITAAALLVLVATSIAFAVESGSGAKTIGRSAVSENTHTSSSPGKATKGMISMCLAMDLKYAKLETILLSSGNGSTEHFKNELSNLELHLSGTPEGDLLEGVLRKKDLTYFDLLRAFDAIETKLISKLKGEEGWAFRTGLKLMDILFTAVPGMEAELQGHMKDLEALVKEGQEYTSKEEIALLAAVIEIDVTNQGQAAFDRIVIQASVFTEVYMDASQSNA